MLKKMALCCAGIALFIGFASTLYAFDNVTPQDAYMMAVNDPDVFILDVRTLSEWKWVGHPGPNKAVDPETGLPEGDGLAGKVVNISYLIERNGEEIENNQFMSDVRKFLRDKPAATLITMCRSGGRSLLAAGLIEAEGYDVLNMVTGFEGSTAKTTGYRTVNGWKVLGLPYSYSAVGGYITMVNDIRNDK